MSVVDSRGRGSFQFTTRTPVPQPRNFGNNLDRIKPLTKIVPSSALLPAAGQQQDYSTSHHRSKTGSSDVFPPLQSPTIVTTSNSQPPYSNNTTVPRRMASNSTTSTANTAVTLNGYSPGRTLSAASSTLRRSESSRSGASTLHAGYVASMRKQRATVWCDRAQYEDPRIIAQQKAAKMRATREVFAGDAQSRTSMSGSMGSGGGLRSKIRHHGAPKAAGYTPNLVGGGVPMRLSASEVGDEIYHDDDEDGQKNPLHQRTSSGRSSLGSSNVRLAATNQRQLSRNIHGGTGQGGGPVEPPGLTETSMPRDSRKPSGSGYFARPSSNGGSGSSSEREASFGDVPNMSAPSSGMARREDGGKSSEELRRRGSVDDRAGTMSGVRLFVANPDLSD